MSAPKHTPAPWHLVSERRSQGNGKRGFPNSDTGPQLLICGPAGATVITRRGLAKPSKPEGIANARLIAAAPDLLASLDPETLEAIADEIQCFEHSARAASLRGIAKRQRAAEAKATGADQ